MILTFPTFYRKFGVRQLAQLVSPTLNDYKFLELPSDAAYHHLSFDGVTTGPANDETLFRNIKRPISVENVLELAAFEGGPKRTPVNAAIIARQFFTTHRRMRLMRGIAASASDKNTPLVFNYAILPQLYRYPQTPLTGYYKWRNQYATVVDQIIKVTEESTRQNFVFAEVPNVIPSLMQLNLASNEINTATLRPFQNPDAKLLLELWKWLGADRQSSIFSRIPKNKIHLVNVVFVESGKWSVVNLGMLNSWRKPDADEASDNRKAAESGDGYVIVSKQTVNNKQLAMRVLRMFMSIMEARTITLKEERPKDENADILAPAVLQDEEELDDEEQTPSVDSGSTDPVEETITDVDAPEVELAPDATSDMTDEEFALHIEKEDTALEQDLQLLNDIAKKAHEEAASDKGLLSDYLAKLEQATPEQGIETLCDKLAVDGLITPVEARKYVKLATNYKTMKAADGISTLEDFIKIDPASLTLDNVGKMPDNTSVIDKSMLTSSLNVFDEKYITDILHKDYANVMLSVQRAGIAVTQYKVERTEDILGGYEDHTLKISPVIGQPSTLRFKLPIVNPDGTYTTNGVKYRLRKQRGDLPIRKTAPNKVALTSYYGKVFVARSKRNSDNYSYWLQTQVTLKAIDREDNHISNSVLENSFDHTLKAPMCYSAVSMTLKTALVAGYHLVFDRRIVMESFPSDVLKQLEVDGAVVFGASVLPGAHVSVDKYGQVWKHTGQNAEALGTLEEFLGIDAAHAPQDYATASVYAKDIPVGIILGLELGFDKLMEYLNVKPRRVPTGSKELLGPHKYTLAFSDETLVFDDSNKFAAMILAGFNEYRKTIKLFSVYSFNKRGVYVNLLETNGLGTRYIREIDMANTMFVDPITRDILIEMKEPTSYQGLLFRACEMLLTSDHPSELDPALMRIKGYERFSGAIYTEIIQSMRTHNGALSKASSAIAINPYAVWKRISEDPAKLQATELNPIAALKECEAVTYGGMGGRSSRSMTKHTRGYHTNDMGTISEATVDNSDVGINVYTSADPQFTSLRGMSKRFDFDKPNATSMLSTSALLSPSSDADD